MSLVPPYPEFDEILEMIGEAGAHLFNIWRRRLVRRRVRVRLAGGLRSRPRAAAGLRLRRAVHPRGRRDGGAADAGAGTDGRQWRYFGIYRIIAPGILFRQT